MALLDELVSPSSPWVRLERGAPVIPSVALVILALCHREIATLDGLIHRRIMANDELRGGYEAIQVVGGVDADRLARYPRRARSRWM